MHTSMVFDRGDTAGPDLIFVQAKKLIPWQMSQAKPAEFGARTTICFPAHSYHGVHYLDLGVHYFKLHYSIHSIGFPCSGTILQHNSYPCLPFLEVLLGQHLRHTRGRSPSWPRPLLQSSLESQCTMQESPLCMEEGKGMREGSRGGREGAYPCSMASSIFFFLS